MPAPKSSARSQAKSPALSPSKQHIEWLSLVEASGPFLTLSVLNQSFKFGLDAHDPDLYRTVKEAYTEWDASQSPTNPSTAIHTVWIRFLLTTALGYPTEVIGDAQAIPESLVADLELQGERIRPDLVILDPDDPGKAQLPILTYPKAQKLDSPVTGSAWSASPHSRMQILLQNTGFQAGFVTNGVQWSLVHVRKGEATGFATFQTALLTEEKLLLQAFRTILGVERTIGAPVGETLFDLLDRSAEDQEEVTTELGRQVRKAVEVFLNALERLDQDAGRTLLAGIEPKDVYNSALTVMMRLIFLLCAEERDLMDNRPLYAQYYSVASLNDQLREAATLNGQNVMEQRHDAWMRLLATFRLLHGGCNHEDLNLIAYGGSLFDPERYPFLEKAKIDNRVTLHLLDALEYLEIRIGSNRERRRLSFAALGVEQIGHVYEGLLDHTAIRAPEPTVGLTGKETEETEIALSQLEAYRSDLGAFFEREKIKVSGNPERLMQQEPDLLKVTNLRTACAGDDALFERALPFLNVLRADPLEHLQIYPTGSLYMTAGEDRRSSGAHYTPLNLTEEMVQYALEPLVYIGPAEGKPRSDWKLLSAPEIVDLKICDIAMGSGAFLVQVCRYLSDRLVEAWAVALEQAQRPLGFSPAGAYFAENSGEEAPLPPFSGECATSPQLIETPFGQVALAEPGAELISDNLEERRLQARRIIADRCLFGVDKNPMAAEIAKLSLWLITMHRDRPLTFLDHALKSGDSLVGVSLKELESFSLETGSTDNSIDGGLYVQWVRGAVKEVRELREAIRQTSSSTMVAVREREERHHEAEAIEDSLRAAGDLLLTTAFRTFSPEQQEQMRNLLTERPDPETARRLRERLGIPTFHFPLEFPDVFAEGGFHAVVGNPPFIGGKRITGVLGEPYREYLVRRIGCGQRGHADVCAYFFLRAAGLIRTGGYLGYLATNSISQGDTREVGLDQLLTPVTADDPQRIPLCSLYRAVKSIKWPSRSANLNVAKVWLRQGEWPGKCVLDDLTVPRITAFLDDGSASGAPERLKANEGKSFIGSFVLGMGFVLEREEALALIVKNAKNADVLMPYLNGEDLNSRPDQSPSRWVINFHDWPLGRIGQTLLSSGETLLHFAQTTETKLSDDWLPKNGSRWAQADTERQDKWLRIGVVPADYPNAVAADYPDCLTIIEERVRPERQRRNDDGEYALRSPLPQRFWQYGDKRPALYAAIADLPRVLAIPRVSKYLNVVFLQRPLVSSEMTVVLATDSHSWFSLTHNSFHDAWVRMQASTMGNTLRYTPSDCLETFPFPTSKVLDEVGEAYDRHRSAICLDRDIGLTKVYNLFHDSRCTDPDISELRRLHIAMDAAVAAAYGWQDIALRHDFYGDGKDTRFTLHPNAKGEVLRRLLALNHERYAAEVAAGLHDGGKGKGRRRAVAADEESEDSAGFPGTARRNLFDGQLTLGEG